MVKFIKYLLVTVFAAFQVFVLNAQQAREIISDYGCRNSDVSFITVKDMNFDGVYDTYSINWCNGSISSYPILAIGDIRKWPPSGIPNRDIVSSNQLTNYLVEAYYTVSNNVLINWFIKYANCDTVYFYDNTDDLRRSITHAEANPIDINANPIDIDVNPIVNMEFATSPNPAKDFIDINYSLKQSAWVTISLYNDIGIIVDVLHENYQAQGMYNIRYDVSDLVSGKYFMTVKLGVDNMFTRQIVIEK